MHIACDRHGSRIMFFPNRIIHRSDGSPCYSIGFGAGEKHFLRHELKLRATEKAAARSDEPKHDPAENLLRELFMA